MRLALALLTVALMSPLATAALPAQPQLFAVASAREPLFFAESPLDNADTLRVEAAGTATVVLKNKITGAVVVEASVTGAQTFTFPGASGNHRITLTLASGVGAVATVDDAP